MFKITEGKYALGALTLFAVWLFIILPLLYWPETVYKYQTYPNETYRNSANDPKGSVQAPFFVQVLPSPDAAEKTNQENEDRLEKRKSDTWLVRWTMALFLATGMLFIATGILSWLAKQQIALARDEFLSTHRPQLRLKHIWLASQDGQSFIGNLQSGVPIIVRLDIVNFGNTTAWVTVINFVTVILRPGERLPQRPPYNEPETPQFRIGPSPLGSGFILTHAVSDGRILSLSDIQDIRNGTKFLYFVGTIEYVDAIQRGRQTGFCRRLKFTNYPAPNGDFGRFQKEKDPDYEWKD